MIDFWEERECPVCHKKFLLCCAPNEYGWSLSGTLYCSYGCMRKVEKRVVEKNTAPALRKISPELASIWQDMLMLRAYSKQYDRLRRQKYSEKLSPAAKEKLPALIAECSKRVERLKCKYAYGIGKLGKLNYTLIYRFAICGWDRTRLLKETDLTYGELCDRFEEICRSLKRFQNVGVYTRRWICG